MDYKVFQDYGCSNFESGAQRYELEISVPRFHFVIAEGHILR